MQRKGMIISLQLWWGKIAAVIPPVEVKCANSTKKERQICRDLFLFWYFAELMFFFTFKLSIWGIVRRYKGTYVFPPIFYQCCPILSPFISNVKNTEVSPQAQTIKTGVPLSPELCGFLFTPVLPWTCAVTYPWTYTGMKVESQHSRLDCSCSWFLFKSSEIQLKLVEPCAFGTVENKAFELRSLKMPIC